MSTVADRVKSMSASELYDASQGKGGATGYDDSLGSPAVWADAATEELKRRGFAKGIDPTPPAQISADAKYLARAVDENSGRIIKHMWIILVLLPVVLGILYEIVK